MSDLRAVGEEPVHRPRVTSRLPSLDAYVRNVRRMAGRDSTSPFSLEDVYALASALDLSGVLYLEKADETRHVTVLLGLDDRRAMLYDPLVGVKVTPCDEILLGLYGRPVGALKVDFEKEERGTAVGEPEDVWAACAGRGRRLRQFLRRHRASEHLFSSNRLHRMASLALPALQRELNPSDCAPLSLFVLSFLTLEARRGPSTDPSESAAVGSGWAHPVHARCGETIEE
jgi:hypothetical protein